jgi:hypothetical protein
LIYDDDNLLELIADYCDHVKRRLDENQEWKAHHRSFAAANNELRNALQKEAILEIYELQATYWHDDVVREALGAAIDTISPSYKSAAKGKRKSR